MGSSGANLFLFNLLLELEATAGRGTTSGHRFFPFEIKKTIHNITVRCREKRHVRYFSCLTQFYKIPAKHESKNCSTEEIYKIIKIHRQLMRVKVSFILRL